MSTNTVSLRQNYRDKRHPFDAGAPLLPERHGRFPNWRKIVINMGLGEAKDDSKVLERASRELSPKSPSSVPSLPARRSRSRTSRSRAGMPIGLKVTLRGDRMWVLLEKLINVALPRVRDFQPASTPTPSTGVVTTTSACVSNSSSPNSRMTRLTPHAAWTSPSSRRRKPTRKRGICSSF